MKMRDKDFTTTILVDQTPEEVFNAINNVGGWWQGEVKGAANKLNDEFTYQMEEFHFSRQRLIEVVPNKKIVWLVTESKLNFIKDKSEWTGTKICFAITEIYNKTKLQGTSNNLLQALLI